MKADADPGDRDRRTHMSRKDYTLAASVVRSFSGDDHPITPAGAVEDAFVAFFRQSEGRFDEARFRAACRVSA